MKLNADLQQIFQANINPVRIALFGFTSLVILSVVVYHLQTTTQLSQQTVRVNAELNNTRRNLDQTESELQTLKNQDQYQTNLKLAAEISNIHKTYKEAVAIYERLLALRDKTKKTDKLEEKFAKSLTFLSDRNYASSEALLAQLDNDIKQEETKFSTSFVIPANVATSNAPPGSGYSRQKVDSDVGSFLVDIIAADLGSTRVIVDTASDSDCHDNCPVASLGDYAGRSGAFAGINGPYFCPASYPSCAGKANSFDTLLMNKNKHYFNSDNNVYSTVPAVIFSGSSARFVGASQEWGRDTSVDSVIAAQPMLMSGGNIVFGGDNEVKRGGKGSRSFIGTKGSTVYIGVVQNANVAEVAHVLKTLGLEYALNLDSGGSTALWSSGRYLVGPGRNTPFGILLVRK